MASFLQVDRLTKSFGDRMLFADITFGINEGDKIGLIARNGYGKTTLLRCLAGLEDYDSGEIIFRDNLRIGYLEQVPVLDEDKSILENCLSGEGDVVSAIAAYEAALASGDAQAIARASERMDFTKAWDYEQRLARMLDSLGITDIQRKVGNLSGGERKRIAIGKILLADPELLILDEPTNHLDIATIEWLEDQLSHSKATLLMVTHDRYFLDRVCDKIIEIDRREIYTYEGNYDYFLRRRRERIEAISAEQAKLKNLLRKEQEWMNRQPQARAGKAKYRIDNFYAMKDRAQALNETERNVTLRGASSRIGSKIFEAEHISKSFGDRTIIRDFSYTFTPGAKVGIVGANGAGKSTLIKMLQGIIPTDSGAWNIGTTVRFGYYRQEGIRFSPEKKVIDAITEYAEDILLAENSGPGGQQQTLSSISPMQYLQRFLFEPADLQKPISALSGGERSRLQLAAVLMQRPNFLILDEPTNDLDLQTLGILEEYLSDFGGCVIIISHDRYFLDNLVDELLYLPGNGEIERFPGTYTEFRQAQAAKEKAEAAAREAAAKKQSEPKEQTRVNERPRRLSYKEQKEYEQIGRELEQLNAELANLEAAFQQPSADFDMATASARYADLKALIDEKELRWLELDDLTS